MSENGAISEKIILLRTHLVSLQPCRHDIIIILLICILGGNYIKLHHTIRTKNSANNAVTLVIISLQHVVLLPRLL